jgi:hypothetical protein
MNTSISISKVITQIQTVNGRSKVTNHKMNELVSIISDVKSFEIWGTISVAKFNKYHLQIMDAGFMVLQVINNEFIFDNGIEFRILYTKVK